jgi:predicted nucleic acid-binding protein
MKKYRDVPMDYADAMLVALSEDIDTDLVFTLDLRDFSCLSQKHTHAISHFAGITLAAFAQDVLHS